jgi:hypothetical protein
LKKLIPLGKMQTNAEVIMKLFLFCLSLLTLNSAMAIQYSGEARFKAETNMPGVSIEGTTKTFKTLKAEFSADNASLKSIEAEIDAETLKTGIELRDHHMFEKVFMVLSDKQKPSLLKLNLDKADCKKEGKNLNCTGDGHFVFGKKSFDKKINIAFDENLNSQTTFNISLKELALEIPGYLGIELEDQVNVNVKGTKGIVK